jgi:hypothetical protein
MHRRPLPEDRGKHGATRVSPRQRRADDPYGSAACHTRRTQVRWLNKTAMDDHVHPAPEPRVRPCRHDGRRNGACISADRDDAETARCATEIATRTRAGIVMRLWRCGPSAARRGSDAEDVVQGSPQAYGAPEASATVRCRPWLLQIVSTDEKPSSGCWSPGGGSGWRERPCRWRRRTVTRRLQRSPGATGASSGAFLLGRIGELSRAATCSTSTRPRQQRRWAGRAER